MPIKVVRKLFSYLPMVWDNPLSLFGAGLTTTSAFIIVTVLILDWTGFHNNPYTGIIVFLIMPALFITGLILMPVGRFLWRKRRAASGHLPEDPFILKADLSDPRFQRKVMFFGLFSLVNILIVTAVSYQAVTFMDSNEFCGTVCHQVMTPEYVSYQRSPHSRVHCVNCHIGPGASWFVKYKLSGLRQVAAVALNTYPRPIPTPVENLRPARETCEQCHWPEKISENRIRVMRKHADDEKSTPNYTVLLMKVGGSSSHTGKAAGIHWHIGSSNKVEYLATDRQRQTIPWVRLTQANGKVTEYLVSGSDLTPEKIAQAEKRLMDCVDCHNRPTHIYTLPDRSVDQAMFDDLVDSSLPFIRKKALELIKAEYPNKEAGLGTIYNSLLQYYQKEYPDIWKQKKESVVRSASSIRFIYDRNVYPEMNLSWGTYTNNIGHTDFPGCYRCHDDNHKSADGRIIRQDCDTCHSLLAVEEAKPPVIDDLVSIKP